ncbi:hypothetical protein INS49_003319 [Diaporthe citri]|uniref:uncharacterized protein n=1 Tax=Diaporthe citri TaxID=83186 RepID=UPI001C810BE4|nr:uncharacterized protein INS49_003319 [Diaporthe citri]KAG6355357.1 hypothetical protein INS49_003319 [Diaporthe citri]
MNLLNVVMQQRRARELGIHVLVGKRRRPQSKDSPGVAQYDSVWAFMPRRGGTLEYDAFNAVVMDKINTLAQQESEDGVLTFFSPIGKYMSFYMTPFPVDLPERIYVPPPTSLMTNPSTRSDDRRPLWVEFQIHGPSSSPTDIPLTTEVNQQLRRLDSMLSSGPDGHNALHLAEVPASTPDLTAALAIDKRDFVCVAELSLLVSTLNSPSDLVENMVTRFGTVGGDEQAVLRGNYADLLGSLSRDLFFSWVREGDMETVLRKSMGDEEPGLVMRPGFTMLMQRYGLELAAEMARLGEVLRN